MKHSLRLIALGLMITAPLPAFSATYSDGDACTVAGAIHENNDSTGAYTLICNGSTWVNTITYLAASKNIGLWEDSPTAALDIGESTATTKIRINGAGYTTGLQFDNLAEGYSSQILWNTSSMAIKATNNGTSADSTLESRVGGTHTTYFRIAETKDTGADSVAASLEYAVSKASGGDDLGLRISKTDTASTGTSHLLEGMTGGVYQFWMTDDGSAYFKTSVGIANDAPDVALDVTGDIEYTGVITDVSDRRLKKRIQHIPNALAAIRKLNGVSFIMKNDPKKNVELGLIAQDVQQAFPALVKKRSDGTLSLNYPGMIGPLVEATKQLDKENQDLEKTVSALEKRLEALEEKAKKYE